MPGQRADGSFDACTASSAVVLNITFEADGIVDTSFINEEQVTRAFDHLLGTQCGGLIEDPGVLQTTRIYAVLYRSVSSVVAL